MIPQVRKLDYGKIELVPTADENSEILVSYGKEAIISYNMGISWEKIPHIQNIQPILFDDRVLLFDSIQIGFGFVYFLDVKGSSTKEIYYNQSDETFSRNRNNPMAAFSKRKVPTNLGCFFDENPGGGCLFCRTVGEITEHYYTSDGGAIWEDMETNSNVDGFDQDYNENLNYFFIDGGMSGLIYKTDIMVSTEYAFDCGRYSPLEFNTFPFRVYRVPDFFFGFNCDSKFCVSKDGVNFEPIEYPNSPRCENSSEYTVPFPVSTRPFNWYEGKSDKRFRGSFFINRSTPPVGRRKGDLWSKVIWNTLFRYDVTLSQIKFMLDHCYDFTVLSAEEGITIARIVTNSQGCLDNNEEPTLKTVITFNDGADWQPINGPGGSELNISNIFHNDEIPSIPGLLIVHGEENPTETWIPRLDSHFIEEDHVLSSFSTYMTKDSGRTWSKIHDKAMSWAVGGNGEVIVLHCCTNKAPIDHITYSLDCGSTWHKLHLRLPQEPIKIQTSHSCNSRRFLIGSSYGWTYYSLSFDPTDQEQSCSNTTHV